MCKHLLKLLFPLGFCEFKFYSFCWIIFGGSVSFGGLFLTKKSLLSYVLHLRLYLCSSKISVGMNIYRVAGKMLAFICAGFQISFIEEHLLNVENQVGTKIGPRLHKASIHPGGFREAFQFRFRDVCSVPSHLKHFV